MKLKKHKLEAKGRQGEVDSVERLLVTILG
jgi:hypothetical protein